MWSTEALATTPVPSALLDSVTMSDHSAILVGPIPWFATFHCTRTGRPDSAVDGVSTSVTTMSANGIGMTSKAWGAAAALLASPPFSKTTLPASVRTKSV